jgi:hypothetical protein
MFYFMENPSINGCFGGTPILGNHHLAVYNTEMLGGSGRNLRIQPHRICDIGMEPTKNGQ